MPAWVVPAISAAAGLLGGERKNRTDQKEAAKNRAFQREEAVTNRAFQERMRNTEWQAAVADMHAAGINPAVAYSQGGAASPGGSMGGGAQASGAVDSVSSAMQLAQQRKGLKLLDQQIRKTNAEADSATANSIVDRATQNFLVNVEGRNGVAPLRRQLTAAIEGAETQNDLRRNQASVLGPQAQLFGTIERALIPILNGLSNAGGRALNYLKERR